MYILRLVEDLFRVWFESISGRFKIYLGFIWGEVSDSFRVRLGLLYFFWGVGLSSLFRVELYRFFSLYIVFLGFQKAEKRRSKEAGKSRKTQKPIGRATEFPKTNSETNRHRKTNTWQNSPEPCAHQLV